MYAERMVVTLLSANLFLNFNPITLPILFDTFVIKA